jgi:hypothetical protein
MWRKTCTCGRVRSASWPGALDVVLLADGLTRHGGRAAAPLLVIGALVMEVLWHDRHLRPRCHRRLLRVGLPPSRSPPPMSSPKRRVFHSHRSASRKSRSQRRRRWSGTVGAEGVLGGV